MVGMLTTGEAGQRRRRQRVPAEERRRQLVEVGARVFALKGYSEAGTADIARACGIAEPTIYRHFSGKEEFFLTVARAAVEQLARGLKETAPHDLGALEAFLRREAEESPHLALLGRLLAEARWSPFREEAEGALGKLEEALSSLGESVSLGRAFTAGIALLAAGGLLVPAERWAA
jgi:AcrR family transcriptional regulator